MVAQAEHDSADKKEKPAEPRLVFSIEKVTSGGGQLGLSLTSAMLTWNFLLLAARPTGWLAGSPAGLRIRDGTLTRHFDFRYAVAYLVLRDYLLNILV